MNSRVYRLVLNRLRGMRVPMAESARTHVRAGVSGHALAAAAALATLIAFPADAQRAPVVFASKLPAPTANLPQPYGAATGRTDRTFVANPQLAPRVKWSVIGNQGTFDQGDVDRVILNWDSFNIGAGYRVNFKQNLDPTRYVSALNRIWSSDPSIILGQLTADREVILVNANGVYFGRGARVDTGKFVATTLGISDAVFEKGIRNVTDGSAVFSTAGTDHLPTNLDSAVSVEAGAEIRTAAGGDVLLIAPRVVNQGRIETSRGQAILAAGDKVYLVSSANPAQRGLIVGVDPVKIAGTSTNDPELGIVENAATGSYKTVNGETVADSMPDNTTGLVNRINEIAAESGTINLVGLAVRQNGNLRATTAVRGANGAIYLQAQASTVSANSVQVLPEERGLTLEPGAVATIGDALGTVTLGAGSVTAVLPSSAAATQFDSETFNRSLVRIEGKTIHVASGSRITAPAGEVTLLAADSAQGSQLFYESAPFSAPPDASRIIIDAGARIDVAGLRDVAIDGARNQGDQRLFRIELADAPVQRTGPLYRSRVFFDTRISASIGVADVTGAAEGMGRTATELSTVGGAIRLEGDGAVVIGSGAELDIAGGSLAYSATTLQSSLLTYQGRTVLFDTADRALRYGSLAASTAQRVVPAYTEGKDGGSLRVNAKQVAFEGEVRGAIVEGQYQRDGRTAPATPAEWTFGRQEVSTAAFLYLAGVRLDAAQPFAIDPSIFASPLNADLTQLPTTLDFSTTNFQRSGVGRLNLIAGRVEQATPGTLDFGPRGAFSVLANEISLDGGYLAPGGTIRLETVIGSASGGDTLGDISLSSNTWLDTAGLWTNDLPSQRQNAPAPIQRDGGTVEIGAARSLRTVPGSRIDVSAGASIDASGKVTEGTAGTLALSIGNDVPADQVARAELQLGATLRGFDFSSGGALTLGVPRLTVGGSSSDGFTLPPEFFSSGGFGSVSVDSYGDVTFKSGTTLSPVLSSWILAPAHRQVASGPMDSRAVTAAPVDQRRARRAPVSLAFNATAPIVPAQDLRGSSVIVEPGASIALEPGASLSLQATRNVEIGVGGSTATPTTLHAPGGDITLAVTGPRGSLNPDNDPAGFIADQSIWLGAGSAVLVGGTALLRPDTAGAPLFQFGVPGVARTSRTTGTVFGGGTINLRAERGYVIAESGSSVNLDGFSTAVSLPGLSSAVQVSKPAGTLNVSTPEGFVLDGSISARAPVDASGNPLADGGRLNLQVGSGGVATGTQGPAYPDATLNPRQISVDRHEAVLAARAVQAGDDLNAKLGNGVGYAPTRVVNQSGFDAVALSAGDKIQFEGNTRIEKRLSIELDAPAITAQPGAQVALSAPRVAVGNTTFRTSGALAADTSARADVSNATPTRLSIDAQVIDITGVSGLQGFGVTDFNATLTPEGEVRLTGQGEVAGQLNFAGELNVRSGQTYVTSGSRFTLAGIPDATIAFGLPEGGSTGRTPLSARGQLTVTATDIDQGGVLRQPFGTIELNASRQLRLAAGGTTSVSADGVIVPFGETANLAEWQLLGANLANLPVDKAVRLTAPTLVSEPGAKVSGRGGGDIQASEFFPGVGGSSDYFLGADLYAVLPDYTQSFAPRGETLTDALSATGTQIQITMPGSPLPPGRYTVLPARYALLAGSLPRGAFLISRAGDQGNTVMTTPIRRDDGSVVVTGYLTQAGSVNTGQPGERFVIEPEATYRAKSELRLTQISDFLDSRARSLGAPVPVLPRDAAALQMRITSSGTTPIVASIDLSAPEGARAGQWDVSAPSIAVVDSQAQIPAGAAGITIDTLVASGAGSISLGAVRSAGEPEGTRATVVLDSSGTNEVSVLAVAQRVQVEELLLSAAGRVNVANDARINATNVGTQADRTLQLSGPGALIGVSANRFDVTRDTPDFSAGSITIGQGAQLSGASVELDATRALSIDSSAAVQANAFSIGAQRISVGGPSSDPSATVIDGALLTVVKSARELSLRSYSSIDFVGVQDFAQRPPASSVNPDPIPANVFERLTLDSPTIRGVQSAGAAGTATRTDIAANDVTLRNTSGVAPQALSDGQGSVRIEARPPLRYGETGGVTIGPGQQSLNFATAELVSRGDVVLDGAGRLQAQGDLTVQSARVTATTGATQELGATGALVMTRAADSRTLNELVGQGASVKFSGQSIAQNGVVDMPGGVLQFDAAGTANSDAITFGAGSLTYAGGFFVTPQPEWNVYGGAGKVTATTAAGRIAVLGAIDVSAARAPDGAAGQGDAGTIAMFATGQGGRVDFASNGQLLGRAGAAAGDLGGRLAIDAQTHGVQGSSTSVLDSIAAQAVGGGFTREVEVRIRSGDATFTGDLVAQRVAIAADQGSLALNGARIDARKDAGGVVQLAAGTNVVMDSASTIDARSARIGANGGDVLLSARDGRVQIGNGARIDTRGDDAQDGRIVLRAQQQGSTVNIDPLNSANLAAGEVDIEAVRIYQTVTAGATTANINRIAAGTSSIVGSFVNLGQTTVLNDANAFMANAPAILTQLGVTPVDQQRVVLRAGAEVRAAADLTIASDWALNAARPGNDAGFLTLRAADNLNINSSLSDGFTSALATAPINNNRRSWSYRLAGGADLTAANPLSVVDRSQAPTETGNVTIATNRFVRTGAGSIEVAAGRDIQLAGSGPLPPGAIYVAGRKHANQEAVLASLFATQSAKPTFTEQGGRLDMHAARDITAPAPIQLINNWYWRSGLPATGAEEGLYVRSSQFASWTEFTRFRQTVGSFGGGDVIVEAGRDVRDLAVMSPTSAWADSRNRAAANLILNNGGDIEVIAGRDVVGGQFFAARGVGRIDAAGRVTESDQGATTATLLAVMEGQWRVNGRDGVTIAGAINPTAISPSAADGRTIFSPIFYSYSPDSAVHLKSNAGAVTLAGFGDPLTAYGLDTVGGVNPLLNVAPPTLTVAAMGADAAFAANTTALLFSSNRGDLKIYAADDVLLSGRSITMADVDPSSWPTSRSPLSNANGKNFLGGAIDGQIALALPVRVEGRLTDRLPHAGLHASDPQPARIHAGGSIIGVDNSSVSAPKPTHISAARDISEFSFLGLNLDAGDVTTVTAGRNFTNTAVASGIVQAGPGALEVTAGRQIDLGQSLGISTSGSDTYPNGPRTGASIKLTAGAAGVLNGPNFEAAYLTSAGSARWQNNRQALLDFVRTQLNASSLEYDQALALFNTFPASAQRMLANRVLAAEFGNTYLASTPPSAAQLTESLRITFETHRTDVLTAGQAALAANQPLVLPGNEVLSGAELSAYLADLTALRFEQLDLTQSLPGRVAALGSYGAGWKAAVAESVGSTVSALEALGQQNPSDPTFASYSSALTTYSGPVFERYRDVVLAREISSAGAAASNFGVKSLPMRQAFYDQGFTVAELAGVGNFAPQPIWSGRAAAFDFLGTLNMTQSSVITRRGGDISLIAPGGAVNVGLKALENQTAQTGVIAVGGGNVFGFAKNDFQVNDQRVFIVGQGDMTLWSSFGDIDSGRGANTAVGAPALRARRSADGVVFEVPPTTTGSGLGILPDGSGVPPRGTIGLYPAFGEILALDAFIRAPSVIVGSTVRGADNLISTSISGATAPVSAPALSAAAAPSTSTQGVTDATLNPQKETAPRSSLLTVELLGLGTDAPDDCKENDPREECKKVRK